MIRALLVDDSLTARLAMRRALESGGKIRIVGEAGTGAEALSAAARHHPDIVLMDVCLGNEDGLDVAEEIMSTRAVPILVVTGLNPNDSELAFRALAVGALEVRGKLPGPSDPAYEAERRRLIRLVESLSAVPVVTRRTRKRHQLKEARTTPTRAQSEIDDRQPRVVVIGGSTGAPPILRVLMEELVAPYPIPIVIAQHLADGFASGLAAWLSRETGQEVLVCSGVLRLKPAVYLASDNNHLEFLSDEFVGPPLTAVDSRHTPSIDRLFESVPKHFGRQAVGILLSGMGNDGAAGLASIRGSGALCIAQRPDTCVVDSMPASAISMGAADKALDPDQVLSLLNHIAKQMAR